MVIATDCFMRLYKFGYCEYIVCCEDLYRCHISADTDDMAVELFLSKAYKNAAA